MAGLVRVRWARLATAPFVLLCLCLAVLSLSLAATATAEPNTHYVRVNGDGSVKPADLSARNAARDGAPDTPERPAHGSASAAAASAAAAAGYSGRVPSSTGSSAASQNSKNSNNKRAGTSYDSSIGGDVTATASADDDEFADTAFSTNVGWNVHRLTDADFDVRTNWRGDAPVAAVGYDSDREHRRNWLLAFTAPWCGHCKTLKPILSDVADALKRTIYALENEKIVYCILLCLDYVNLACYLLLL